MQRSIMVDEALYQRALELSDAPMSQDELVTLAMKTYIALQAGYRLGELGGCAPEMEDIPRRRWDPEEGS
nr:type II toxin-antitoxin system VapB family antitoxin [uncultured Roseateles sp.]